jgi:CheY-like chemotaxis protein
MDGEIGVDSVRGEGTTFWFTIAMESLTCQDDLEEIDLSDATVLIVDDNATNRELLLTQLVSWGLEVSQAASGREAIDSIEQGLRPDIILLDLKMPDINGLDTAAEIRAREDGTYAKIVLLSSLSGQLNEAERISLGIESTLTKPVRQKLLKNCLSGLLSAEDADEPRLDQPLESSDSKPPPLNLDVLLVEDNIVNQEVAKAMLAMLGCKTTSAVNGKEAVELLVHQQKRFDVVLMDCQMPEMDGFTATRAIREYERSAGQPTHSIIALTANALTGDRERCLEAGMNDYLPKPFTMPALRKIIAHQLGLGPRSAVG